MTLPVMRAEGISRSFGKITALDDVSVTLEEASFVALLGPAGAGKTTFLRICAGLEVPQTGRVHIGDRDVTPLEPKDRDIAMIFDSLALYPNKTGYENIASPLRIRGLSKDAINDRVLEIARSLHVSHTLARQPRTMSGGERQRIALGRALVREPAFFLLDEPLSSLDAQLRIGLRAELRRLQQDRGASFLYATPDFTEAMAVADTIVLLLDGRVRQVAAPQTLYDDPSDRDVARFVGAPEINLAPAEYDPSDGGQLLIAGIGGPAGNRQRSTFNGTSVRFQAGLRPEHVKLIRDPDGAANATVIDNEPLGLKSVVTVETASGRMRATVPEQDAGAYGVGQPVAVTFDVEYAHCFDRDSGQRMDRI